MAAKAGTCPICLNYFEGLHEHHVIPRELMLNGIKGVNGPLAYLCGADHDMLHRQAKSDLAQTGRQYFTTEQRQRAAPYLQVLVASMVANEGLSAPGQMQKVILQFTKEQVSVLHSLKTDHGSTNLSTFLQSIIIKYVQDSV